MTPNEILGMSLEQIEGLPSEEIPAAVQAAFALKASIEENTKRLEALKERFRVEAREKLPDGKKRDPDGENILLFGGMVGRGMVGPLGGMRTVKVSFAGPKAIAAFWFQERDGMAYRYKDSRVTQLGDIRKLAGKCFSHLFYSQFKPTKQFAQAVDGLVTGKKLSRSRGEELIRLCLEETTPKVELVS